MRPADYNDVMQWNERLARRAIPALAAALICATGPALAVTHRVPTYRLPQPDAPIRLTGCAGDLGPLVLNASDNVLGNAGVDYHNKTKKRITGVEMQFFLVNAHGRVEADQTWNGRYNYPVPPYGDRVWTRAADMSHLEQIQGGLTHTAMASGILCAVAEVDFADGTSYVAPVDTEVGDRPGPYAPF